MWQKRYYFLYSLDGLKILPASLFLNQSQANMNSNFSEEPRVFLRGDIFLCDLKAHMVETLQAAESLRFHLWNVAHPSCHPTVDSVFSQS